MKPTENGLNNLKIRASYGEVGNDVYTVGGVAQRSSMRRSGTVFPTITTSVILVKNRYFREPVS